MVVLVSLAGRNNAYNIQISGFKLLPPQKKKIRMVSPPPHLSSLDNKENRT